eukprot:scpid7307/ scgid0207/ Brefeldin A-inhibited guanine nucleotide-exchange protein 2
MAGYSLFLERALEKILSDRETRRSQHAKLKQKCEQALERLQAACKTRSPGSRHSISTAPSVSDVEYYYLVLEHVCQSRSPRLVSTALDCLQKLIAPGYLTGLSPDPEDPTKPLGDRIVDTICSCFSGASTDEDVQLQIIKALLTMMTSGTCSVHEGSLLQVIRTCYNIFLASKKPINQATAKTTLTQVIHAIFQRMEQQKEESVQDAQSMRESGAIATTSTPTPSSNTRLDRPSLPVASMGGTSPGLLHRNNMSVLQSPTGGAESSVDRALTVPSDHEIMQEIAATSGQHTMFGSQELRSNPGSALRPNSQARFPSSKVSPNMSHSSSKSSSKSESFSEADTSGVFLPPSTHHEETGVVSEGNGSPVRDTSKVDGATKARDTGQEARTVRDGSQSVDGEDTDGTALPEPSDSATGRSGAVRPLQGVPASQEYAADSLDDNNGASNAAKTEISSEAGLAQHCDTLPESVTPRRSDSAVDQSSVAVEVQQVLSEIVDRVCNAADASESPPRVPSRALSPVNSMTIVGPNTVAYVASDTAGVPATETSSKPSSDVANQSFEASWGFEHVVQKDAFLVFRSLCKLSMKAIESHDPRSHELRSKILSLELLLSVLEGAGPMLRTDPMFINAIKQYLCVALSKNGVSSVPQVFDLSLSIFLALLSNFKDHLKMQIEVFFKEIFLNILQSTTSSFQHKLLVTLALRKICNDAQCIVTIYLNYDCDLSLANIFERLVSDIAHIAQGSNAVLLGHPTPQQEKAIQYAGMECLVGILKSLVAWSSDLYVKPGVAALAQQSAGYETAFPLTRDPVSPRLTRRTLPLARSDTSPNPGPKGGRVHESPVESASSSQSLGGLDLPEEFEVIKKKKDVIEEGLVKFHKKPKHGMKFLQERDIVGREPSDVALFFHSDDRLDPVSIGEYLGEADKYCIEVMYSYVDLLDFTDMEFVPALRMFLAGFRLPGEAQKIDRLMEKFAGRYCETNASTSVFASADTAYVLAYSIIMLATDLHSTKIKRENKMTKEQYIKMNRGINDQKDLPSEYLESIYDEIAKQEITLRGGNKSKAPAPAGITDKTRQQLNDVEMEQMAQTAKAMMEDRSHVQSHFIIATRTEHARPMFKVAWTPFLAALSVALREDAHETIVALCLEGFRAAIRVAAIFDAKLERNAFVQTLAKFTLLTSMSGVGEMKPKHIETAKILISVADTEGNYLQGTWADVLNVVSHLELAQAVGNDRQRLRNGSISVATSSSTIVAAAAASANSSSGGGGGSGRDSASAQSSLELRDCAAWEKVDSRTLDEAISQTVVVAIDRIFTNSNLLDGNAILDFVNGLIGASFAELESRPAPRMFSLQKIVEISYYNMGRIRLEWSRIWAIIGEYFNRVGCHSNEDVAVFAIDSLRQLSMKFLERGELANFRFQKDFLRPFEYIMKRNMSPKIRDMVVSCMAQMVHSHAKNIRSGWKNIFAVFHLAASDHDPQIVELAFETTSNIFEKHFAATIAASFQDAVKCLAEFSCNAAFPDTSMEAIRRIDMCARCVANQPHLFRDTATMEDTMDAEDRVWVRGWFPVLFELSCIISRCKLDVRTRALTVMFNIMKTYGASFLNHWWRDVFNIIFRIFDNMKLPEQQMEKTEWMTTTCPHTLMCIVDVFSQYFEVLAPVLLDNLYSQFSWSAQQDNKELAIASLDCLESFVTTNGRHFSRLYWDKTVDCLEKIFSATLPQALLMWRSEDTGDPGSPYDVPMIHIHIPRKASIQNMVPSVTETRESFHSSKTGSAAVAVTTQSPKRVAPHGSTEDGGVADDAQLDTPRSARSGRIHHRPPSPSEDDSERSALSMTAMPSDDERALDAREIGTDVDANASAMDGSINAYPRDASESPDFEGPRTSSDDKQRVFGTLDVRCHVQQCLIRAIDHIIFTSVGSKHQDQRLFYAAAKESDTTNTSNSSGSPEAMFPQLSSAQLLRLVYLLMASHDFAKLFNADNEQRAALWKAGFQGKSKINMWKQETQSLLCVLRILFSMLACQQHASCALAVEETLINIWQNAVAYYCTLVSLNHRTEWLPVLLFLIDNLKRLEPIRFDRHLFQPGAKILYKMVTVDMQAELRCVLRDLLERMHDRACCLRSAAHQPAKAAGAAESAMKNPLQQ